MVVMAISDVLTMNFFWLVRDEGSWLDIGTSISHFCIASMLCVFVAGLEFVSEVIVSGVEVEGEGGGRGINWNGVVKEKGEGKGRIRSGHGNGTLKSKVQSDK